MERYVVPAKSIMIQGTGSNVGKSIVAAALCRILAQDGYRVAPFKSQNMSLNSFVTRDGLEMGRAQVVQAEAAGIEPMVEMNPILLKPTGDSKSQVVMMGRPFKDMQAKEYYKDRGIFLETVKEAYCKLSSMFDVIVIEGAGSPAEINIKDRDIVNMRMAEIANAPVLLVTDIDRGGAFAWLAGTMQLLKENEKARVKGVIFNKFRGDIGILEPGYKMLEDIIFKPVLGTIPLIEDIEIDDEDSVSLDYVNSSSRINKQPTDDNNQLDVVIIKLTRISNFTDFDLLSKEGSVSLRYVKDKNHLGNPDLIIIPGTKGTISDLYEIKESGLAQSIIESAEKGCTVIGICGGFQMLGYEIRDRFSIESENESIKGLGFIDCITDFEPEKDTYQSVARIETDALPFKVDEELTGYEIHMGRTTLITDNIKDMKSSGPVSNNVSNFLNITRRSGSMVNINDGFVVSKEKKLIIGTYLHGIFDNDSFRTGLLTFLAKKSGKQFNSDGKTMESAKRKSEAYKRLADVTRKALDMDQVYKIINNGIINNGIINN